PSPSPVVAATVPKSGPQQFGDYELIELVGRGGMGLVYRARELSLNRTVALKMILRSDEASADHVKRFYTEAQAAAKLDHPRIVPVYHVGQWNDQHFYTMGFVEGASLAQRLTAGPLAPRQAAVLLMKTARAGEYAHR